MQTQIEKTFKAQMEDQAHKDELRRQMEKEKEAESNRVNRFNISSSPETPQAYQKRIEELRKTEEKMKQQMDYKEFKKLFLPPLEARLAKKSINSNEKYFQRMRDLYEPISKERNMELLDLIDAGVKATDNKVDETKFNETFSKYIARYNEFIHDMLEYQTVRQRQCEIGAEISQLSSIAMGRL